MSITLLEAQAALDGAPSLFVNSERGYVSSLAREKMQSHAKATRESFVADKGKRGLSLLGGFRASREFGAAIGRRHHHVVSTGKLMVVLCAAILYAAHADAPKVAAVAAAAGSEKGPKEKKGKKKKKQKGGDAVAATQSLQSTFVFGDFLAQETEQEAPEDFLINDLVAAETSYGDAPIIQMRASSTSETSQRLRRLSSASAEGSSDDDDVFAFSDFAVSVENNLDEEICEGYAAEKPSDAEEESMFVFGDFAIGMTDEETAQVAAMTTVKHKSVAPPVKKKAEPTRLLSYETKLMTALSNRVKSLTITSDERILVTSNSKATCAVGMTWHGEEVHRYIGHQDTITSALISNDDKLLATTSRDNTLIIWDLPTARQLSCFPHPKAVTSCSFSKNSHYIVTGCQDWQCRLFSVKGKRAKENVVNFREHMSVVTSVSFESNGECVVSASADTNVMVWNAAVGKLLHTYSGHRGTVLAAHFSSSGRHVLSNDSQEVILWSWDASRQKGNALVTIPAEPDTYWTLSCFLPGKLDRYFVAALNASRTGSLQIYDLDVCCKSPHDIAAPALQLFTRAPIHALTPSRRNVLLYGDVFGNLYSTVFNKKMKHVATNPIFAR